MSIQHKLLMLGGALALGLPMAFLSSDTASRAADHLDPPTRTNIDNDPTPDIPADIADVYAWHTAQHIIVAVTFAGPAAANTAAFYDRDVLYTINISNAGARTDTEFPINFRFGQNNGGNGVQITGVPGAASAVFSGPVETNLVSGGVTARAGLVEDPFFFDLIGFRETLATGNLALRNDRDFFAGKNDTVLVIQMPRAAVENGANPIDIWATTARFGGNL